MYNVDGNHFCNANVYYIKLVVDGQFLSILEDKLTRFPVEKILFCIHSFIINIVHTKSSWCFLGGF